MRGWLAILMGLALLLAGPAARAQELVTIGLIGEPQMLDPTLPAEPGTLEIAYQNIFEGLTRLGADGEAQPDLAQAWEASGDGLRYTFHIRSGVRFHDGTTLSARQVTFSLERLLKPESGNPERARYAAITGVSAPDTETVVLTLSRPMPDLPKLLALPAAVIVAPESADANAAEPLGTGPFAFVEWDKGEGVLLERNEDFWGGRPAIYHAQFAFAPDAQTALGQLHAGHFDAVVGLDAAEIPAATGADPRFAVVTGTDGRAAIWSAALKGYAPDPGFPACVLRSVSAGR